MARLVGAVLQVIGLAAVSLGAFTIALWLGFVVAGASAFAIGFVLERG